MIITYIIIGIIALVVGLLIAWFVGNGKRQKLIQETAILKGQIDGAEKLLAATKENYEQRLQSLQSDADHDLQQAKETWETNTQSRIDAMQLLLDQQEQHHKQDIENQSDRFNEMTKSLEARMKEATEKLLKERQTEFAQSSTKDLDKIISPLNESIKNMKEEMEKTKTSNTETKTSIETSMQQLIQQNIAAQQSAEKLTTALHHQPKVQGDWGEDILNKLLDAQGLRNGVDYEVQPVLRDDDGNVIKPDDGSNMRPDVILHIDTSRDVIIDSKVSLTDYIDYANATDETARDAALDRHVKSIEKHVRELAAKNYQGHLKKGRTLGFVIMFVPLPQMLQAATIKKPTLWASAMESRVFIADEQTLYAALKIISLTWKQIEQEENQKKLFKHAGEVLDRIALFLKQYDDIGKKLKEASDSYDAGKKKLMDGGPSIPTAAKNMLKLGATYDKGTTKIPDTYLNPDQLSLDSGEEEE